MSPPDLLIIHTEYTPSGSPAAMAAIVCGTAPILPAVRVQDVLPVTRHCRSCALKFSKKSVFLFCLQSKSKKFSAVFHPDLQPSSSLPRTHLQRRCFAAPSEAPQARADTVPPRRRVWCKQQHHPRQPVVVLTRRVCERDDKSKSVHT
jgi:hypothetical protein